MIALAALQLIAGVTFSDDFESGVLLRPAGQWSVSTQNMSVTIGISDAGPHRGLLGLRQTDNDSASTVGAEGLAASPVTGLTDAIWLRSWVRTAMTGSGAVFLLQDELSAVRLSSAELLYDCATGRVHLVGYQADGGYGDVTGDAGIVAGRWQLIELASTGVGTAQGVRWVWVDGKLSARQSVDFSGGAPSQVVVGQYWASPRNPIGTIDFDDVRYQATPNATWLDLNGPPTATVGDCVQFTAQLGDVMRAPAQAPYDVAVAVSVPVFSDSACQVATNAVTIPAGMSSATAWASVGTAGMISISGSHVDFLTGNAWNLDAGARDAGPPDAGPPDAGPPDAGPPDAGPPDAGPPDAGPPDAGPPDAGPPDAGPPDAGPGTDGGMGLALDFALSEPQLAAGALSGAIRVRVLDASRNPAPVGSPLEVTLHTSSSRGGFTVRMSDLVSQTLVVTVPAGGSESGVYYQDYSEGFATLTATAAGVASASAIIEITAAPAAGCGCGSSGTLPALLAALLLIAARRSPRACRQAARSRR